MRRLTASTISAATLAVAALWWFVPGSYPYGAAATVTVGVNHWIERGPGVGLMAAAGVLGVLAALALRSRPRAAGAVAAAESAFFLLVMSDASVLSSIGYALIPAALLGVAGLVAAGCVRRRPVAYVLAVLLPAGLIASLMMTDAVPRYLVNVASGFAVYGGRIAWSWAMAGAAVGWAWVAYGSFARGRGVTVPRWGRAVTIAAALCPVPYAVARLTWATPWPLGGYDPRTGHITLIAAEAGDAATRIQGFLIGLSAVVAVVLTLGLIGRWGEVVPRWVPWSGGRPVPVALAVGPGAFGAVALCVSAPGVLAGAVQMGSWWDGVLFVLMFPCPVWGPLLGAAVFAYRARRSAAAEAATPSAGWAAPVAVPGESDGR
ncbi:hypothetical protein [Nonomuraea candida]|uniref:hypothetical protein n=1 Tax=Nonomuraea candida TaxID=359159 RepID=UPI000693ED7D|nr:hypothetical protein [Nonomuraea candida]